MTDNARSSSNVLKFILLNLIGIFMFFVTISVGGKSSIPIDHIVTGLRSIPYFEVVYAGLIVVVGAILPFVRKTWNKDAVTTIFSIFKVNRYRSRRNGHLRLGAGKLPHPGYAAFRI